MRHRRLRPAITGCEPTVDPPDDCQITSAGHFGDPHPEIALRYDPANSRAIGHYATQQNTAYNVDGDVLNREPSWPKRSDRNHSDALNKRVTAWRETDRQKADAPYHIHQEGGEQVWEAKQRLREARAERLERIAHAIAGGDEPKKRDTRPHRRTVAHRTRKHSAASA